MKNEKTILVCSESGSEDIEQRSWKSVNTGKIVSGLSIDFEDRWCNDCIQHVDFIPKEDFKNEEQDV